MPYLKPGDPGYISYGDPLHGDQDIQTTLAQNPGMAKGDIAKNLAESFGTGGAGSLAALIGAHFIPVLGQIPGLGSLIGTGIGKVVGHFTKLGREKKSATEIANLMHSTVWNDIMPKYQAGEISKSEAKEAIQGVVDSYKQALQQPGLKDVSQRSLDQVNWLLYNNAAGTGKNFLTDDSADPWSKYAPKNPKPDTPSATSGGTTGTTPSSSDPFGGAFNQLGEGGLADWSWTGAGSDFGLGTSKFFGTEDLFKAPVMSEPSSAGAAAPKTQTTQSVLPDAFKRMAGSSIPEYQGSEGAFGKIMRGRGSNIPQQAYNQEDYFGRDMGVPYNPNVSY